MAELRGLVRGLEQRATAPPDVGQLEKLFEMVQRSQQGYRDLIDTFEDLLFSISADGEILAANRSFADLLGPSLSRIWWAGRSMNLWIWRTATGRAALQKPCRVSSNGAIGPACCAFA